MLLKVTLDEDELGALDHLRGGTPRATYVRGLIRDVGVAARVLDAQRGGPITVSEATVRREAGFPPTRPAPAERRPLGTDPSVRERPPVGQRGAR